ncbi:MAG: threonine/serine exporter family protein [Clostridia bacterium]|nr:threonine/serine exporter family protein [Clostridia bacterium]
MSWWMQLIACCVATIAYSALVRLPRKAIAITALIASAGYGIYLLMDQSTMGYFLASLLIGVLCEICARIMKRAATLFMTAAIIPLVPGVGLYRTMRYIVEGNAQMALSTGTATLLGLCGIALALTVSTVLFANLRRIPKKKDGTC